MSDPMPTIVPPLFWEWFNIWLIQFLKDLYNEIKMLGLRGNNTGNSPYSHTCANHGAPSLPTGIDMTLNIPTSLTMSSPAGALNPNQINMQSLSTVSLQFVAPAPTANPGTHNHHSHNRNLSHGHIAGHNMSHSHVSSHGLGGNLNHTNSLGSSSSYSHNHTINLGIGNSQNHTNSLGLNAGHSGQVLSGSHGVGLGGTNNVGLGGSLSHSNNLGLSANHSSSHNHNITLGLSGNHSHSTNIGLGGIHSSSLNVGGSHSGTVNLGGSHSHTTPFGLGGSHSHTTNLGLGGSNSHTTNLGLGGSHSHNANLGLGGSHSHISNLPHGGSHIHGSNLGINGSHSHSNCVGLSGGHSNSLGLSGSLNHSCNLSLGGSHNHNSNLGIGGNHNHSSNLGLSGNQSHSSNLGLCSSHCHGNSSGLQTLNVGLNGSQCHSSNLNLGSHSLISSVNHPISCVNPSSHNLSLNQNPNISQQNLITTTSHNQSFNIEPSRYSSSNCVLPSHAQQYRLMNQACRPVECYHPSGATAATYMPSSTGGTQSSAQASLRIQPTPPQPSAPPVPQQDLSKTTMASHNFVSQTQTQPRPQYANFQQYRGTQHGSRPNSHPRQQQPFIPGTASSTGPVMYPTLVFPTHMGMQTYQQPRSGSPGYYQYHMGHYIGYNNPPSHTSPYYGFATNSPQLPTPSLPANSSGGRNNPTTLVAGQGSPATPASPAVSIAHTQPPAHHHQSMPGIRPAPAPKRSHRLAIIDPVTRQDIFSDFYPTNNEYLLSGEQNDRQTPQPEPPTHSIAEEFTRMVNEAANQPSHENAIKTNFVPKNVELAVSTASTVQPQNAISSLSSINNNVLKSDLVNLNDNRSLGPGVAAAPCETPVVSAISDSPVIVPKMTLNVKPIQKIETNVQSIVIDTSKYTHNNKQSHKCCTPILEKVDKEKEVLHPGVASAAETATATISPPVTTAALPVRTLAQSALLMQSLTMPFMQNQRASRDRVYKSEEKDKYYKMEKEIIIAPRHQNGPMSTLFGQQRRKSISLLLKPISSVESFQQAINFPTSQTILNQGATAKKQTNKHMVPTGLANLAAPEHTLTATELLSAGIEKVAREHPLEPEPVPEKRLSAFEAQAKLTESIASVCRAHQSESKMKDIHLNSETNDPDTANGNATEATKLDSVKEDINKNEKSVKNTKNNSKKAAKMANNDAKHTVVKDMESCENGEDETDKVVNVEQEIPQAQEEAEVPAPVEEPAEEAPVPSVPAVFVPKYKYTDEQWSPLNKSGKKCYDIGLLKQIKEDPLSKNKPDAPLLEACNVIRTAPMQEPMTFTQISRPINDSVLPSFMKSSGGSRNTLPRDPKKDGRSIPVTGKGSVKLSASSNNNSSHKQVIHVSLSMREDVKLNEVDSAWKPTRFRKENITEEEVQTQELYKKFRGILNKLTPQKFSTLLEKVKELDINNQKRMEGVIDLLFEKAIEEPNFSEAYANMCLKLSTLKVPSDINPEQSVNFRGVIINKCQTQFETGKSDEQVMKMEKDLAESNDPAKKKELQAMIDEENRKIRLRAVANVRFIGELYKLKMLTCKIMDYCMKNLIDKLEEEKLECLCKLLTTIGEQFENEGLAQLDAIFKKMHDIVDRRSNNQLINSRVKFMIQDVIDLRRRKWTMKSVVDSQPKMMDQIQKEAEQQQRHVELMNASGGGGGGGGQFRRDDGGRGKRGGDNRRQNSFFENNTLPRPSRTVPFIVDQSKFKAVAQKNLSNIKLAPPHWNSNYGAGGAKPQQAPVLAPTNISISSINKYSILENTLADPTSVRANRDTTPTYHAKGASIERSTFNSRGDYPSGGGRSGSVGATLPSSGAPVPATAALVVEETAPAAPAPQEPLPNDKMKKAVKSAIDLSLINQDEEELAAEVKQLFAPQYHAAVIGEILSVVVEKSVKEVNMITKSILHLVATNVISPENFVAGLKETFEYAPDLFIDIPMLYDYLGKILAPHIEKKHITLQKTFDLSESIIAAKQGHLLLKAIIHYLNDSMGPTFVKAKWQESGLQLSQWMSEELTQKWVADNKFEFLEGDSQASEASIKILTPAETQSRLLELMNADENCECVKGWVLDKLGKAANEEDWVMRVLIQAICEHALESRDVPHFNQDRMNKYVNLIHEFGDSKESREANCLFGIQSLIHRLEHPQGLTLGIFQYLHEQYLISLDGFLEWEKSEKELEGKGVMLKVLTSFFTNIKEADNEDSGSED